MDTQNTSRQFRYLEEVRIPLHRAGFGTLLVEGEQLPVLWNGAPLCRITGKGSVFYRREDADTPQEHRDDHADDHVLRAGVLRVALAGLYDDLHSGDRILFRHAE